jgi:hypothetical protein
MGTEEEKTSERCQQELQGFQRLGPSLGVSDRLLSKVRKMVIKLWAIV